MMLRFIGIVIISAAVSLCVMLLYLWYTSYLPRAMFNDALQCVIFLGESIDQKLTFNITGVMGERSGDLKWLWIIGEDVAFGDTNRPIYCRIQGETMEVTHPTLGIFRK